MTFELWILVKATVVLAVGLIAARLASRARASLRHLLLASTFGALLVLPLGSAFAPAVVVNVPVAVFAGSTAPATPSMSAGAQPPASRLDTVGPSSAITLRTKTMVQGLWSMGALVLLATLAGSLWTLRRIRRSAIPWIAGEASARALALENGVSRPLTVALHERIAVPVTCGLLRPTIVLPPDAREWPAADLRRAFVHELEHVRRADWWIHVVARAVCAAYWFHPLVWIAWRRLGLESERACDDAVVSRMEQTAYAEQLVTLAARLSKQQLQPMLSMANRSDLSVRVHAVLDATQLRGRPGITAATATIGVMTLLVGTIAPLRAVAVARESSTSNAALQAPRVDAPTRALDIALLNAAGTGEVEGVTELLNGGGHVNAMVPGDGSPLIAAARGGHVVVVRLLLNRGADPDLAVRGDGSPLIAAAREGHLAIVIMLLDRGVNIDRTVEDDENPLIQASAEGQLEVVKLLVTRGANVNARAWAASTRQPGGEWRTPLNMARKRGHDAVASYLVSAGAVE